MHNKPHTEEAKKKIGNSNRGKIRTDNVIKKLSESHLGNEHTPEAKQKMSLARIGVSKSEEHKRKLSESNIGKHPMTEKRREAISKANKGRPSWNKGIPHTEEHKQKLKLSRKGKSSPMKGKHHSPETRKKISNANKGKVRSEEFKKNLSEFLKGHFVSLETRKKIGESSKTKFIPYVTDKFKQKMSNIRINYLQENELPWRNTKPEQEAESILKKYNLNYKKQFRINYLNSCKFYDFYLPDYNILLEIDGTYWHSKGIKDKDIKNRTLKDCRINDKLKDKLAKNNGYTLIRIWSDEMFKLEEYCSVELNVLDKAV